MYRGLNMIDVSICILSYNRPKHINDLLQSIDLSNRHSCEIIILDDFSPQRQEIKNVINVYKEKVKYDVKYFENETNKGYDITLSNLVNLASGEWIVFMGDDDLFVPKALDKYLDFVKAKPKLGYVMKAHYTINQRGVKEYFRYFKDNKFFEPGPDAYLSLFRRSVFISGFMIRSSYAKKFNTKNHDGSLLTQLYLLAKTVLITQSAYLNIPFTCQYNYNIHNENEIMYDRVANKFIDRVATVNISLDFLESYVKLVKCIDSEESFDYSEKILLDMSKYSYPSLALQRELGLFKFTKYVYDVYKLGFGKSIYFKVYYLMLIILGKKLSDRLIYGLRNKLGFTPQL
jgi:glycosyltransferase involved in cell wall biosynthesis